MPSSLDEARKPAYPPITNKTILLSFDVESNGLHGPEFAVGAVVMRPDEDILDEFNGRTAIRGSVDPWVKENVMPALQDMPINYRSRAALRQAFWEWFQRAMTKADYVLVSNGYPVEMRFLIACQNDDLKNRYWQHPLPLVELNSLLLQIGESRRHKLIEDKIKDSQDLKHNPRWDAWVSALAAFEAFRRSGRLKD